MQSFGVLPRFPELQGPPKFFQAGNNPEKPLRVVPAQQPVGIFEKQPSCAFSQPIVYKLSHNFLCVRAGKWPVMLILINDHPFPADVLGK
jgi:hypothetical protein